MATFIPAELVAIVLEHLHRTSQRAFAKCLRVCHMWRIQGRFIRWKHICLRGANVAIFVNYLDSLMDNTSDRIEDVLSLVCSITFRPEYGKTCSEAASRLLDRLPQMTKLETISFHEMRIGGSQPIDDKPSWIDCKTFFDSLRKCTNLKNLELCRIHGPISAQSDEEDHLCVELYRLMPRLHRLRLCGGRLCHRLLSNLTECCHDMQELIVNKSNFEFWNHCENKAYSNSRNFRRISIEALIAAGKQALHAGRFPNIFHFIVSGKRQYDQQRDMNPGYGDLSFSCRYVADIRKDITTVYPAYLGPLDCYEPFLDVDPGQPEASTWMLFRDHETGVICNFIDPDICDTYAFIDEPSWWLAGGGVRLPMHVAKTKSGKILKWLDPLHREFVTKMYEPLRKPGTVQTRLWYWEERVGRPLIHVQRFQGAHLPERPLRESPPEEQQFDYNAHTDLAMQLRRACF